LIAPFFSVLGCNNDNNDDDAGGGGGHVRPRETNELLSVDIVTFEAP